MYPTYRGLRTQPSIDKSGLGETTFIYNERAEARLTNVVCYCRQSQSTVMLRDMCQIYALYLKPRRSSGCRYRCDCSSFELCYRLVFLIVQYVCRASTVPLAILRSRNVYRAFSLHSRLTAGCQYAKTPLREARECTSLSHNPYV